LFLRQRRATNFTAAGLAPRLLDIEQIDVPVPHGNNINGAMERNISENIVAPPQQPSYCYKLIVRARVSLLHIRQCWRYCDGLVNAHLAFRVVGV